MALLTFPLIDPSVAPQVGAARDIVTSTSIKRTETGLERRRVRATIPTDDMEAHWNPREDSRWIAEQLAAFFRQSAGPAIPFVAYDWDYSFGHQRIYVGTGDGTRVAWNLPCRDTASAIKVYSDGVEQTTGLTLSDDGDNEAKKATFGTAPVAGKVLTCSFTGQLRIICRFGEDQLRLEFADAMLYGISVSLVGLKGEE
jgi:hypothetical protein